MSLKKKVYTKKDPISHILDRSDMYVGSKKMRKGEEYIAVKEDDVYKIVKKEITSSPAILRIFVEILSNAIDNVERSRKANIPCSTIKVVINKETGETSVWNDGDTIPVEINDVEKIYNHSLIFGNLLTGSNYNDEEERLVSGRNGLGSKLTNCFSEKFIVKGLDPINKKTFEQMWTNNMRTTTEPKIKDTKLLKGYTYISYFPDFKQFGIDGYTDDIINLYTKYVLDAAMLAKVKVYLNDNLLPVHNLVTYVKLYESPTDEKMLIHTANSDVLVTTSSDEFQAISFVNGVYTKQGGQHVDAYCEVIFRPLVDKFNKKGKPQVNIKDIKQFFKIFVVSSVVNPEFSNQEKTKLESPKVDVTGVKSSDVNKILKWSVISDIEDIIKSKEMLVLKKSEKKKKGYTKIDGLDQANLAGTKHSHLCSLILCEGLSAKTYAVAGIQKGIYGKSGRDYFGVLSLLGKVLNCRNAVPTIIAKNKVVTDLIQALGLQYNVDYTKEVNYKTLSYGKVVLLTDADCFTDDTALLVKKNNKVSVIQIDSLYDSELNINTQLINDTEVWNDSGWVNIKTIRRNVNSKRILTINTYSGIVRCTEDHTFLLENGKEIKAKDIKIGDRLLRRGMNNIPNPETQFDISIEEAWVWGLFFAYGTCDSDIIISICDYEKLTLACKIMKEKYCYDWKIYEVENCQKTYNLTLDGCKDVRMFISEMRNRFYTSNKLKKVPDEILNNTINVQESFFKGYKENKHSDWFDVLGQVGAQGLCYITERLGYSYNIKEKSGNHNVFTINISKSFTGEVKNIYETEYKDRFIYDIETDTGKINAGIGNMVQRQCDGIHIEGLIMNFFHALFPSLLQRAEPYLVSMKTPIVRVFNPKGDILFYDENRFHKFMKEQTKPFKSKYYKGLGTTKSEDVPDTFGEKMVEYVKDKDTDESINKVFHKKFSDDRKKWLEHYNPNPEFSLDDSGKITPMNMSSFLNDEVIKFSHNDCKRSIPSLFDGLKESQRKCLYAVKKRNLTYNKPSLKVAQLGGYVAEHTNYHHGEQNLYDTIVKMAQEYPGTNNIPLLYRDGMFGTRLNNSDAASARYIFTKMEPLTPLIFREEDDVLLDYVVDDGDVVEPKFYIPIIPMILVNGANGIGSGWSSSVPSYNPLEIIECIKIWLDNDGEIIITDPDNGDEMSLLPEMVPYYRDFEGKIEDVSGNKFVTYGSLKKEKNKVYVTELPIGMWTDKFKEMCEDWLIEKKIKGFQNYSTPKKVNFTITESEDGYNCNLTNLKMYTYLHTSNMVLFNEKDQLKKYTIEQIIEDFCIVRYDFYKKRKKYIVNNLEKELVYLGNKARFISEIITKKLNIMNVEEERVINELEKRGYNKSVDDDGEEGGYNYLLKMQIRTFTAEKVNQIKKDILSLQTKLANAKRLSEKQMWLNDLDEFAKEYSKWLIVMNNSNNKKNNKKK